MSLMGTVNDKGKMANKLNGDDLCFVCLTRLFLNSRSYKWRYMYALNYVCAKTQQANFKLKGSMLW
jgi:hypothetical protein